MLYDRMSEEQRYQFLRALSKRLIVNVMSQPIYNKLPVQPREILREEFPKPPGAGVSASARAQGSLTTCNS